MSIPGIILLLGGTILCVVLLCVAHELDCNSRMGTIVCWAAFVSYALGTILFLLFS